MFRSIRMPLRLKDALALLRRAENFILSRLKWKCALVFLDNTVVYSKYAAEQLVHVHIVLALFGLVWIAVKL